MRKFLIYSMTAVAVLATALTSCKKDEDKKELTYTVSFNSKGGTPTPQEQTVKKGGKITKPANPTRENYNLVGWAKADNETSALWNFETETVTENITLFARWSIITHAVTFDSDGGSAVTAQNVAHGGAAVKPTNPTRGGYEFDGWFNGDTEWIFTTAITAPVSLKAKWTKVHIVTFDSDGGSVVNAQNVRDGNTAIPNVPTRSGYEFDGWFSGDTEWNFATAITAPVTIMAKWTKVYIVTFDSDGGSAVPAQTIRDGNKATKPAEPTRTIASGLYLGTLTDDYNYTFEGWYNVETLWDFNNDIVTAPITLKAKWSFTSNPTRIESVLPNDVVAAFTYVNANSLSGEEYTLLIGAPTVTVTAIQTLSAAKAKLSIIGIGADRTIMSTARELFVINGDNATNITLQNITLKGPASYTGTLNENYKLISVQRGSLTMRNGSKITESLCGAVYVTGVNAVFKMEGGEISSNVRYYYTNGVYVCNGGTFELSGGSITGNSNTRRGVEDVFIDYGCTFSLSGSARIGTLILNANNATTRASITIDDSYSGMVTILHLRGNNSTVSNVYNWWTNAPVIVNGTASVIGMFNNARGDFRNNSNTLPSTATTINATHVINASGLLVLKED